MGFSFIHMADIHLGRPFSDLSIFSVNAENAQIYKTAVEKSFSNAVNFAIEKNVDFVLIAGDTFDSVESDFASKLILKDSLKKLEKHGIRVFLICGNHDPVSSYSQNTFNFDESSLIKIVGVNSDYVQTFEFDEYVVHALSFKEKTFNENPLNYLKNERKLFNIALLHCDLDADKQSPYAPCYKADLKNMGFDYCALGHIHIPLECGENIFYSGTIQGRNTKETGEHGIRYIRVENNVIQENSFVPVDVIRFEDVDIDLSTAKDDTSAFEFTIEKINSFVKNQLVDLFLLRINFVGNVSFYSSINNEFFSKVIEKVEEEFNSKVCVSKFQNFLLPLIDEEMLKNDDGISGEFYKVVMDEKVVNEVYAETEKLLNKVLQPCCFSEEEYSNFKSSVIEKTKDECLNLCSCLYMDEAEV